METQLFSKQKDHPHEDQKLKRGAPCVNCLLIMGVSDAEVLRAKGYPGQTHEPCIRKRGMPSIVTRMLALIEECQAMTVAQHGGGRVFIEDKFVARIYALSDAKQLRGVTHEQFATIVSDVLTEMHAKCNNGLSGQLSKVIALARDASRRLFIPVKLHGLAVDVTLDAEKPAASSRTVGTTTK